MKLQRGNVCYINLFVCLCLWLSVGRGVNHTGITNICQRGILSAQRSLFVSCSICLLMLTGSSCSVSKQCKQNQYDLIMIITNVHTFRCVHLQSVCMSFSRWGTDYIHPMNQWYFNGRANSLDRFDSFMTFTYIYIYILTAVLFSWEIILKKMSLHAGASHRFLNRLGLSWWI